MARGKKKPKGKGARGPIDGTSAVEGQDAVVLPTAPKRISRPFADALAGVKVVVEKPGPGSASDKTGVRRGSERAAEDDARARRVREAAQRDAEARQAAVAGPVSHSYEDRVAFNQAFSGVAPLATKTAARREPARQAPSVRDPSATAKRSDDVDTDAIARARLDALVGGGVRFEVTRDDEWVEGERAGAHGRWSRDLRAGRARPEAEIDLHGQRADEAERTLVRFLREEAKKGRRVVRVIHGKGLHSEGGVAVLGERVLRVITEGAGAPSVGAFVTAALVSGGAGALLVRLVDR